MIGEMERGWKEAVVTCLKYCPNIYLKGPRKTTKTSVRITSVLDKIQRHPTIWRAYSQWMILLLGGWG
jgi:hypothetical protein